MPESTTYEALATDARRVRELMANQARRPYVLELTGTPKAGKTSTINLLESFFNACGWRVHVVRERAALCPIAMKGHFFFNTWTATTMLAEVIEIVDRPLDLVIVDRGFFDALIWPELQKERGQITQSEADTFADFIRLERWRSLVDATVIMNVSPAVAMEREQLGQLIPREGSVMNEASLNKFNGAVDCTVANHGKYFNLLRVDSANQTVKGVAADIAVRILQQIELWVDPNITVVARDVIETLFGEDGGAQRFSEEVAARIGKHVKAERRSEAERESTLVQLVACGVPKFGDGVFVFDRMRDEKRVGEYGRHSVWTGQHIEWIEHALVLSARTAVLERMQRNLHLQLELEPTPLGAVWFPRYPQDDPRSRRSPKHLGLFFLISIGNEAVAQSLMDKEFKTRGRGHPATSRFTPINELNSSTLELEPWSKAVVENGWLTS